MADRTIKTATQNFIKAELCNSPLRFGSHEHAWPLSLSCLLMVTATKKSVLNLSAGAVMSGKTSLVLVLPNSLRVICLTLAIQESTGLKLLGCHLSQASLPTCPNLHNFIVLWIPSLWIYYQGTCQCFCTYGTVSSFYFGALSFLQKFTLGWVLACVIGLQTKSELFLEDGREQRGNSSFFSAWGI